MLAVHYTELLFVTFIQRRLTRSVAITEWMARNSATQESVIAVAVLRAVSSARLSAGKSVPGQTRLGMSGKSGQLLPAALIRELHADKNSSPSHPSPPQLLPITAGTGVNPHIQ